MSLIFDKRLKSDYLRDLEEYKKECRDLYEKNRLYNEHLPELSDGRFKATGIGKLANRNAMNPENRMLYDGYLSEDELKNGLNFIPQELSEDINNEPRELVGEERDAVLKEISESFNEKRKPISPKQINAVSENHEPISANKTNNLDNPRDELIKYLVKNNYSENDFYKYRKEPAWQKLNYNYAKFMNYNPYEGLNPYEAIVRYLSVNEYGPQDYDKYSRSSEWKQLSENYNHYRETGEEKAFCMSEGGIKR